MTTKPQISDLPSLLAAAQEQLIEQWAAEIMRRSFSLRRWRNDPSQQNTWALIQERLSGILAAMRSAISQNPSLATGSPEFREPIQLVSLLAGWMADRGLPLTDALAISQGFASIWTITTAAQTAFFENLSVVMGESYCTALKQKAESRYRLAMNHSQLVLSLHHELPALFLVGDPDRFGADEALGRLFTLAMMRDAPAVLIDLSALHNPQPMLQDLDCSLADYASQAKMQIVVAGLRAELHGHFSRATALGVSLFEDFSTALDDIAHLEIKE